MATSLNLPTPSKLTKSNYLMWRAQVLPVVRGALLQDYLDGTAKAPPSELEEKVADKIVKKPNPDYARFIARDQQLLSYLFSLLSRDIFSSVATLETSAQVWRTLEQVFNSQIQVRSINIRIGLATTKKGDMSVTDYYNKMKTYGDELASAGSTIDDTNLVSYIVTGLGADYNSVVSSVMACSTPITAPELLSLMLAYEERQELLFDGGSYSNSSVNTTSRGGRNSGGGRHPGHLQGRGRGRGGGRSSGSHRGAYNNNAPCPGQTSGSSKPRCQVCYKVGH